MSDYTPDEALVEAFLRAVSTLAGGKPIDWPEDVAEDIREVGRDFLTTHRLVRLPMEPIVWAPRHQFARPLYLGEPIDLTLDDDDG